MRYTTILALLLAGAFTPPAGAVDPATGTLAPTDPNAPWVEAVSPGIWKVSVQCSLGTETRVGSVLVAGETQPDIYALPHTGLAKARGCRELADTFKQRKSWDYALIAAKSGLDALGTEYVTPGGDDATRDRLREAENAQRQGDKLTATSKMILVLDTRLDLYKQRHKATLSEG